MQVLAVQERDVVQAKNVVLESSGLLARDALHVAMMKRYRVSTINSFDRGFDRICGIDRIPPQ